MARPQEGLGTFEPVRTAQGSSSKRLRIIGALMFGVVCAALTFEGAKRGMGRGSAFVLEQGDNEAIISQLAQQEVVRRVAQQAASGLPAAAGLIAQSLSSNSSIVIDCSRKEAYVLLQTSFASIAVNTSKENATMYAKDALLEAAASDAKEEWLTAEAKYRDAQAAYASAKSAAEYARGKYSDYESAVATGQKEWDELKPKYDEEANQIGAEVPVIEELIAELTKSTAEKAEPQQLAAVRTKVSQLAVPEHDKRMAAQMDILRAVMLKADSKGAMVAALKVVQGLLDTMKGRKTEIADALAKLTTELSDNKIGLKTWEEKVVDLSDAADENKNTMNTQGLVKATLSGKASVAKEEYEDYHATFLDDVARFERELAALSTIDGKLTDAVEACA
mmetsp:Transcript_42629/g.106654  ORF Transcript_42629/g.106654 Transcript_42629/m.106654 type:complete len:392 (-) Transcript_42629:66-1241(-)